jgi:hypothetical protein
MLELAAALRRESLARTTKATPCTRRPRRGGRRGLFTLRGSALTRPLIEEAIEHADAEDRPDFCGIVVQVRDGLAQVTDGQGAQQTRVAGGHAELEGVAGFVTGEQHARRGAVEGVLSVAAVQGSTFTSSRAPGRHSSRYMASFAVCPST